MYVRRSRLVYFLRRGRRKPGGALMLGSVLALQVASSASGCRIYRDDPPPRREDGPSRGSAEPPAATGVKPETTPHSGPSAEALNLWVLNRREGDLQPPSSAEKAEPSERTTAAPSSRALVVLGFGSQHACAEQLARTALDSLSASAPSVRVVTELIDVARRFRWPRSEGTFSAILSSSDGSFGGLQAFTAASFSASAMASAIDRRAILNGYHDRWQKPRGSWSASDANRATLPSGCEAPVESALLGPVGISVWDGRGKFVSAVAALDSATDAGIVSPLTQPGVAVAVGRTGAVSLLSDCLTMSAGELAQDIHGRPDWQEATGAPRLSSGCPAAHSMLTADRAWVASAAPVAWAAAERLMSVSVGAPASDVDAGAVGPSAGERP